MTATLEITDDDVKRALAKVANPHGRVEVNPDTVEHDLARLVLGLVEFLRQLMELQAIRQMENGHLSMEQEEKLGTTLMRAEAAIHDLAAKFDLTPADLSLDLGPLGKTI